MATTKQTTAEELMALPDDGWQYELIEGVLHRMAPAGLEHGEIETRFIVHLSRHVDAQNAGKVYTGDTGFFFGRHPDVVMAPDVAFIRADRLPPPAERRGYSPVIPDLAVEIASPSDDQAKVDAKVARYLAAGVPLVWVTSPRTRTVAVHRPGEQSRVYGVDDVLDGGDVLPGFRLQVADIFR